MDYKNYFIILFILFVLNNASAANVKYDDYCAKNGLGWHFYCDKPDVEKSEYKDNYQKPYSVQLKEFQDKFNEILAKAVLEPTQQNIMEYMQAQVISANMASIFAYNFQKNLWENPELYYQKIPSNNTAKKIWKDERFKAEQNAILHLNEKYGLFFVYSSSCPYCIKYSEILLNLIKKYNLKIIGISIDNNFLPGWEDSLVYNSNFFDNIGVKLEGFPTTILYDKEKDEASILAYGLISEDELLTRIYYQTQTNAGEVF